MIVDTSVWIDFFNGVQNRQAECLAGAVESGAPLYLHSIILMEILQGFRSDRDHAGVKEILLSFDFVEEDPVPDALGASDLYRSLRKKGAAMRKSLDCVIAHAAIKNGLPLLHRDRDFNLIARNSKLQLVEL